MCAVLYTLRGVESGEFVGLFQDGTPFLIFGNVLPPDAFCEHTVAEVAARAESLYGERFERIPAQR